MSETENDVPPPAAAGGAASGILNRMGRLRLRSRADGTSSQREKAVRLFGASIVSAVVKSIVWTALFATYLVVEVLAAMLVYMYLNIYHFETFGRLIGISRQLFYTFATQLENLSPAIADQANATILGELGAKSIFLLFIGLTVSAGIRLLGWFIHKSLETVRPRRAQAS